MWRSTGREAEALQDAGLAEECEAFLAGHWVDYLAAQGTPIPTWGWVNHPAHATEDELRDTARALEPPRRHADPWSQATSFLALELLDVAAERAVDVSELQRSCLVPLELDLFADPTACRLNPGQLAARVMSALRHPSNRRV